jgi:hypothetical protein
MARDDADDTAPGDGGAIYRADYDRVQAEPVGEPGDEVYGPENTVVREVDDGGPERTTRGRPSGDDQGAYSQPPDQAKSSPDLP